MILPFWSSGGPFSYRMGSGPVVSFFLPLASSSPSPRASSHCFFFCGFFFFFFLFFLFFSFFPCLPLFRSELLAGIISEKDVLHHAAFYSFPQVEPVFRLTLGKRREMWDLFFSFFVTDGRVILPPSPGYKTFPLVRPRPPSPIPFFLWVPSDSAALPCFSPRVLGFSVKADHGPARLLPWTT